MKGTDIDTSKTKEGRGEGGGDESGEQKSLWQESEHPATWKRSAWPYKNLSAINKYKIQTRKDICLIFTPSHTGAFALYEAEGLRRVAGGLDSGQLS